MKSHTGTAALAGAVVVALIVGLGSAAASSRSSAAGQFTHVHWRDLPLPTMCGSHRPIDMRGAPIYPPVQIKTISVAPAWRGVTREYIYRSLEPSFGPLWGATAVAAVAVQCANTGGTIDETLETMVVLYGHHGSRVVAVGVLPTTVRIFKPEIPTFGYVVRIRSHQIVVRENFYGDGDSSCCATGRAIAVWDLNGSDLSPHTRILAVPRESVSSTKREPRSWLRIDGHRVTISS